MSAPPPELSRVVPLDRLPPGGLAVEITADAGECRRLAARLGLEAVASLAARLVLDRPPPGETVRLRGEADAELTQVCVVTLEPVPQRLGFSFERLFAPDGGGPGAAEAVVDPEAPDIEPLAGTSLDVGEILAEELALALDPYPRAAGAALPVAAGDGAADGPFAALAALRRRP